MATDTIERPVQRPVADLEALFGEGAALALTVEEGAITVEEGGVS